MLNGLSLVFSCLNLTLEVQKIKDELEVLIANLAICVLLVIFASLVIFARLVTFALPISLMRTNQLMASKLIQTQIQTQQLPRHIRSAILIMQDFNETDSYFAFSTQSLKYDTTAPTNIMYFMMATETTCATTRTHGLTKNKLVRLLALPWRLRNTLLPNLIPSSRRDESAKY